MATRGVGYFDGKGNYFRTPDEATLSDLAGLLGRMGEGDSLAPGIARILFDKRDEIESVFRSHDDMTGASVAQVDSSNVRPISTARQMS
jgi:hypothetical protein